MTIQQDMHALAAGQIVELFEIDATNIGGGITRLHAGVNGLMQPVVWQGNTYQPFPIEASGWESNGRGTIPRPTVRVANITGTMGALVRDLDDLIGAKFTRRRTMVKYLDAVNFPAQRNLHLRTDNLGTGAGGWTRGSALTLVQEGAESPDGRNVGVLVNGLQGNNLSASGTIFYRNAAVTVGQQYTHSVWFKPLSDGILQLRHGLSADQQLANFAVKAGQPWRRFSMTATANAAGGASAPFAIGSSGAAINGILFGAQSEAGAVMSAYQSIGAAFVQNPTADPTAELPPDVYVIDRKASENNVAIEFELAAAWDLAGVMLPRGYIVQNLCPWRYQGAECGWVPVPGKYFDTSDAPTTAGNDGCGKRLVSCKARFGASSPLPFGGFPAAGLTR